MDCDGVCGGSASVDDCGVCNGDNSTCTDCAGNLNGEYIIDDCGSCCNPNQQSVGMFGIHVSLGTYPEEISWTLYHEDFELLTGGAPFDWMGELPYGLYMLEMNDSYGDGWNGAYFEILMDGMPVGIATLDYGHHDSFSFELLPGMFEINNNTDNEVLSFSNDLKKVAKTYPPVRIVDNSLELLDSLNLRDESCTWFGNQAGDVCSCDGEIIDECGVCDGDNSSCSDCNGDANGGAYIDGCGNCVYEEDPNCVEDCAGVIGGSAVIDECGVCNGDNSSCSDCNGVANGGGYIDECGNCVYEQDPNCVEDCTGVMGGSAIIDGCGVCGGNSNPNDCNADGIDDVCEETYDIGFYEGTQSGDINQDGIINVVDIILYIDKILSN